jgi:hypothetical protein
MDSGIVRFSFEMLESIKMVLKEEGAGWHKEGPLLCGEASSIHALG